MIIQLSGITASLLMGVQVVCASTWTVDDDGPADFSSIQAAIDAAVDGDEIIVMPGTYTSTELQVVDTLGKAIWLHSSDGSDVTIIDGENTRRGMQCVSSETSGTIIEGFTITNATGWLGGGVFCMNSSPQFLDCTFTFNTANFGAGLYGMFGAPTITNCFFTGNNADDNGGGVFSFSSTLTMTNTLLCGNTPDQISGPWVDGGGTCEAYSCHDDDGDGVPDNCTVIDDGVHHIPSEYFPIQMAINAAVDGDEIVIAPGTYTGLSDYVVFDTLGKELWIHSSDGPEVTIIDGGNVKRGIICNYGPTSEPVIEGLTITNGYRYSVTYLNGGGGMISYFTNPTIINCIFINNQVEDIYHGEGGGLSCYGSAAVLQNCSFINNSADAGGGGIYCGSSSSSIELTDCTFENNIGGGLYLPNGTTATISNCDFTNNLGTALFSSNSNVVVLTSCTFSNNIDGGVVTLEPIEISNSLFCSNGAEHIWGPWSDGGGNCFAYSCQDSDGDGWSDECSTVDDGLHLVPEEFPTIQAAINHAGVGDEVLVSPGTYIGVGEWVINPIGKRLWIHSRDGAEVTVIDGENMRRGIYCSNGEMDETIFEGFTITNGYGGFGGGMRSVYSGPTVRNCIFTSNSCNSKGAGISGWGGGGRYSLISNCIFIDNHTDTLGGGVSFPHAVITDCVFENNTASGGGGVYVEDYAPDTFISNSMFCGNSPDQILGEYTDGGGNTIVDECPVNCPDLNGDGIVNISDLLSIVDQWGLQNSPADFNGDGTVDVADLLIVIDHWGVCQ